MQNFDLVGVNAAVGIHMNRHLVEVVGTPPLQSYQLPDVREVNIENIAVECHFPHIDSHVGDPSLGLFCGGFHLLPNGTGSVGIVRRRPQLIVGCLPLGQWPCVGQMSPRQK